MSFMSSTEIFPMALKPPPIKQGSEGPRELAPQGTHVAVLYGVIDIGTQWKKSQFGDKWEHQVMLRWELSDEMMADGRPFVVSRRFGLNVHEKAGFRVFLTPWLDSLTNDQWQNLDIGSLIGRPCQVTVAHEPDKKDPKKKYANVQSISGLGKRMAVPEQINDDQYYEIGHPIPSDFPDWLKDLIGKSQEHAGKADASPIAPSAVPVTEDGDEIPF
jgi:hypothetical protein